MYHDVLEVEVSADITDGGEVGNAVLMGDGDGEGGGNGSAMAVVIWSGSAENVATGTTGSSCRGFGGGFTDVEEVWVWVDPPNRPNHVDERAGAGTGGVDEGVVSRDDSVYPLLRSIIQ
jgi:hypothetical protein